MKNKTTYGEFSYREPITVQPKISKVTIENVDKRSLRLKDYYVCHKPLKNDLDNLGFLEIDNQYIGIMEEDGHLDCLEELFTEAIK